MTNGQLALSTGIENIQSKIYNISRFAGDA